MLSEQAPPPTVSESANNCGAESNGSIGKILVVDDEPELRTALVEALVAQGYETVGCGSGHKALEELRDHNCDLLLTDLMMPEIDGISLIKAALEIDPHLVAIIMTGQGTIQTAVDAMKLGAFDYVLKPFRMQTILPVLTRAVNMRHLRLENLQLRETIAIYGLSQTIAFTLDPQAVISKLADAALQQTDADEVSILLPTSDGKELYVAAVRGEHRERLLGERVPLDQGISGWVARERAPLILNGEVKDERFQALWPHPEILSAMSVPMQVANKLVGTINLNAVNRPRPFTLGQMKALTILASTAAGALESASLYGQVRRAEQKYRSIFENAIEGIFQSTPEGRLITANPSMARILGYDSPKEVIEKITDVAQQLHVHTESRAEAARLQEERGTLQGFEFEAYRKDGQKIWLSLNGSSVQDENGVEIYREGSIEDITERKRAEEALSESEERYKGLIDSAFDGVVIHSERTIVSANRAYAEMFGYCHDEVIGMEVLEFTAPECRDLDLTRITQESTYESVGLRKNGSRIPIEISGQVCLYQGQPARLSAMRDITERKRVEEMQARRAARALFRADVGAALAVSRAPLRATLELCAEAMVQHLNAAFARVWTLNREENILELQASAGIYTHINGPHSRVRVGAFKIGKIAEERLAHITNDVQTDPRVSDKEWAKRERMVSFAGYPLVVEDRLLGVMAMFSRVELAEDTLDALASVADLISLGIERKRAEQELRESEERYRDLVENAHDFIYEHDLQGNFTSANKAGERITGYSLEESLKLNLKQIVAPQYFEKAEKMLTQRLSGEKVTAYDLELIAKDSHHVTVEVNSRLVLKDGVPVGVQGIARDITERKRAEEALRESEARKRAILESSMDCIIIMDHKGLVVDWNPAAEQTFGYARKEAIGREMAELIIPRRFRERHRQGLALYLATRKGRVLGQRLELSAERRDGTEFPIELTITRIELRGAPMFTGYLRDITERKKAENRLSAQYAVTRALAESNTISEGASKILQAVCESLGWEYGSLWSVDRKSNALRCSQVWQAPGAEADDFENVSRQSILMPGIGLPGKVWSDSQPLWIADVVQDTNFPRASIAARVGLHGACAFPIRLRSEILGVVEFFSHSIREPDPDLLAMMVTIGSQIGQFIERKRVEEALDASEEQLRQSQKLEAIGQLAGGVAHDFNNLLTAINGYSGLALQRIDDNHPLRGYLEEIKKAGDRAANLTRQLLAFGRKQILQPLAINLNDVVTDVNKMLRRLIGEDIQLSSKLDPVLKKIKADPGQVEQVLVNLVVNARDAMPQGGNLTIETSSVDLDQDYAGRHVGVVAGRYVMLAVSDTGTGMDEITQARIFDPFFTTKEKGKGTGLGLSTVYGIVKQSGGNIWVYSEPGQGTTFKVYFPELAVSPQTTAVVTVEPAMPGGSETILLVEDEDVVRGLARTILEHAGYNVLEASCGDDAVRMGLQRVEPIDLLLTDVVMPETSGKEVADRLGEMQPGLRVLFMSGYTDEAIVHHGVLDTNVEFIQKPFTPATLAKKVREVLDSELELSD